ncbi:MAG: molybdopterin-dependent oxidoreductase [Thermoanaerobaculia bacterium]|nr:molybdopterin-dependent oxidoreductase [Thermoanaerobaculia bacterium]
MTVVTTTCPMDCPDTCALDVHVDEGRVTAIRGSRGDHPTTDGFICSKVGSFAKRVYHESRVLHPLRRKGAKGSGEFERITWDEAISEITTRFQAIIAGHGAEAILPYAYGGSNGFVSDGLLDDYFFARLGASQIEKTLCAAPTGAIATAMYGKMPGVAPEDYVHAKMIVVWGANPKASQIHLIPYLQEARRRGAFVVTIDPRQALASKEVDLHLSILPGTDVVVALAIIGELARLGAIDHAFLGAHATGARALLDEAAAWPVERAASVAGVDAGAIREIARRWAEASPAVMRCGWGLERNTNGAQAVAAVLAIPAVSGKFGLRGGGYTLSNSGAAKLDVEPFFAGLKWTARTLNMSKLGTLLTEPLSPPIKALFVYNCNPVATVPDQNSVVRGLMRDDLFTVVHDQVMTDSATYADIVLPATTFLEAWDVKRGYGSFVVGGVKPAIAPVGESMPNDRLFARLGQAMGFDDPQFRTTSEECVRYVASHLDMGNGRKPDVDALLAGSFTRYDFPGAAPVQFETAFPRTPERKVDLRPSILGDDPWSFVAISDPRFPLSLITPASSRMISSSMGEYNFDELFVELNPGDAARRGIGDGAAVRVFNTLGEVRVRARITDRIRPGVVSMNKGAWMKSAGNGRTAAALCPQNVEPVSGGACYNDARVEVEKTS